MSQVLSPWGYLPDGWNLSTIDEEKTALFDYVANGSFASLAENVKYRETPDYAVLIRLVDYNNNFSGDFVYIDEHAYNFLSKSKLYGDEIIISNVGANVGTVFKAPRLNKKMSLAPNAICVKFKGCNDFYYYWLRSRIGQHIINSLVSGSAQPKFNKTHFRSMPIPVPPIEIQENIASILSSLDDKIAVNRRICENLEAQAQALFKHWFIDFAPFKNGNFCANREQNETCFNSAEVQPKITGKACKFVESELGMIPEGWRVGTLEELCSFISRGLSPKYQLGTNELVLGQTCVRNNIVTLNNAREHQPKENCNKYVKKWDVLLNSTGIGSLGRVGVVYFDKTNVCFDSHLTVVRTKEDIYRYYVGRNLLNRQKELENMAVGSTGQTELPKKDVLVMPILIPNSDVLPEFNDIIENIGNKIYTLIAENLRLSTLRDTLLPKLMSGQIKVNEMEKSL